MNLLVFAGGSQFTAVGLMAAGPAAWTLVPMTLLINLRHLLYGVVVAVTTELRGARIPASRQVLACQRSLALRQGRSVVTPLTWTILAMAGVTYGVRL